MSARRSGPALAALLLLALPAVAAAREEAPAMPNPPGAGAAHADPAPAPGGPETAVKVERVRPRRVKHPTLRFLRENRDFLRARVDLLRQRAGDGDGDAGEIDPRFLAYQEMLRAIHAGRDSAAAADDSLRRAELLASITELGRLEEHLDLMERLMAEQRSRLGLLQEDFTGRQETALVVVVRGYPAEAPVRSVTVTLEDGDTLTVPLTPGHLASLRRGGIVQVFHGFVEPREQVVEVSLAGERWPAGDTGFVTLAPARDRITLLRLDLSTVDAERGATGIEASTWLHDTRLPPGDG